MKKICALILIAFLAAFLSACRFIPVESTVDSDKQEDGVYYTALDIWLVYVGQSAFELQIGINRDAFLVGQHRDFELLGDEIGKRAGAKLSYINYFVSGDSEPYYSYYAYKIESGTTIDNTSRHFGFFDYRYKYEIKNEEFVGKIYQAAVESVKEAMPSLGGYTVDDEAVYLSFGLCTDSKLEAENATWVRKKLFSGKESGWEYYDCLVWKSKDINADFTTLNAEIYSLASGWYIVAIILGLAVVGIIIPIKSKKQADIYRPSDFSGIGKEAVEEDKYREQSEEEQDGKR